LDANLPLSDIKPLHETIRDRISPKRIITVMLGLFASLALLMATVGLYAVMSFTVAQRTHEIGIRLALGAQMKDVSALIVKQGLRLVVIGVVIGLAGAFAISSVLSQILYGIKATDPMTYVLVAAVLIITALFACWIPALRATKVDPMVALRHE
jgi:putative ABC transport system permease protein